MGFPGGSVSKSVCNAEDLGSIPGLGRSPEEGNGNPLQYLKDPHGQRSLVVYSPWGHKELDMTERLHFHFTFHALEKEMATYSSDLAWRIRGKGEPGGLLSLESHRVGQD